MFGFQSRRQLQNSLSIRDNAIKIYKEQIVSLNEKMYEKELYTVKLAADNAVLKQRLINMQTLLDK